MARLAACFTLLFIFLTLLSNPTFGSDPTYTECKPHIEATILDLAAKAVRAGEHPSEPAEQSQPCPGSTAPEEVQTSPEFQSSTAKKAVEYETSPEAASAEQASPSSRNEEKSASHASSPTKKYSPSSEPSTKEKLYGFDNFMYLVFDYRPQPRDPKYANPWQTFPEFGKSSSSEKMPIKKVVSSEPGMISSSINKLIGLVFKVSDEPRDPKWKEPWQTHKGLSPQKTYPDTVAKPKEVKKSFFEFSFINKLVQIVFGVDTSTSRDDKWSKPWTSHVESKKKEDKEVTPKRVVQDSKKGGFINFLVSLVFDVPTGERDPKWLEPWTTHKGLIKEEKKAPEVVKQVSGPGFFSRTINKLVYLVFTEPAGPRDPKYAQPWTSFREVKEKEPKVEVKVKESNFFGMRSTFNKLIEMIFGKSATTRDPKWAQPFQHHKKEQKESSETQKVPLSAAAPHPAAAPAPPPLAASPAPPPLAASPAPPPPAAAPAPPSPAAAPAPPPPAASPAPPLPAATPAPPPPPPTPSPSLFKEAFPSDTKDGAKPGAPSADEQVAHAAKAPVKPVLEEVVQEREPKKEKIIEDQEQIVVVPSALRSREHIESILGLDEAARLSSARTDPIADATLRDLKQIHETAVKPLEVTYKYQDISNRHLSDAELFGTPLVLLLGPYSTGKSTFINYLLGIEFTKKALKTGTPPSHGVFRIVKYGERDREVDGTDLSGHWSFGSLQKFGQNFVDQIRGKELNSPLLKKVTFVEAPGILEMRRPGERLYPFNDVVQWFIDRADLILVMFDYTKLDAGYELEAILDQLKGREAQSRILLNKADQVPPEELIKVQGSLFWNLSPLLGVSAPPTVYAGSFASLPYRPSSPVKLFQAQEEALLHDIARAINSRVDNRIAIARRHAVRVRNHAQMVDTYLTTFYKNKGFLTSKHKLAEEIVENPHAYNIYEGISLLTNISRYDLPDAEVYRDFFRVHNLYNFRTLRETCSYLAGCPLEKLDAAINKQLPGLMARYRRLVEAASPGAKLPDANIRTGGLGAGVAHAHHSKS